jgi:hypothetical protein
MKVNETLTTSSEVGIRAPLSLLSNANRYPDRHATVAGTWIEGVVMALEARRFGRLLGAFWKPVVPDRLIGLADLRHMIVVREDDVGRWR